MQLNTSEPDVFILRQTAQTSNNLRMWNRSRDVCSVLEQHSGRFQHQLHFWHTRNDLWQSRVNDRGRHCGNNHIKCRSFGFFRLHALDVLFLKTTAKPFRVVASSDLDPVRTAQWP